MADATSSGGNVFEAIDPKLTVFALANGVDLLKSEISRRLVWFREGLERGIEVTAAGGDTYSVQAMSWPTKAPEEATTATVAEEVPVSSLSEKLEAGIEVANGL